MGPKPAALRFRGAFQQLRAQTMPHIAAIRSPQRRRVQRAPAQISMRAVLVVKTQRVLRHDPVHRSATHESRFSHHRCRASAAFDLFAGSVATEGEWPEAYSPAAE